MSTAAIIMGAITAASTAMKGYSQYQQGKATAKGYREQAKRIADNESQLRLEGAINEDRTREQNRQAISGMRAMLGEMGMEGSETATASLSQDIASAEQNALDLRYRVNTEANNLAQASSDASFMAKETKKNARNQFYMSLIQGVGDGMGSYYKFKTPVDPGAKTGGKDDYNWLWGSK